MTPPPTDRIAAYTTVRSDVADLVPPVAMSVLDVGCSNGALGAALRDAVPGRSVCGIEYDAGFAREASSRLDRVVHADLEVFDWATEFGGTRFDCIVFADVLEHLVNPEKHLRAALSVLGPGGCVVVSLPNIRHLSALVSIFGGGRFPRNARGLFDATHLRWFTIADGHQLLEGSGLSVELGSFAMRVGDRGGGRANRLLNRLPSAIQHWWPLREFFTYQFCLRARRAADLAPGG